MEKLLLVAFGIIIILTLVKVSTYDDSPHRRLMKWTTHFVKSIFQPLLKFLKEISSPSFRILSKLYLRRNQDIVKRFKKFNYMFGHPNMPGFKRITFCISDKEVVLLSKVFKRRLATIPLNKITDIKIEKRNQARERFTKIGNPLAGVFSDYLPEKESRKGEYIMSIRWQDIRGLKHDCAFLYRHRWRYKKKEPDRILSIRNDIINAKPSLNDEDYAGPKKVERN